MTINNQTERTDEMEAYISFISDLLRRRNDIKIVKIVFEFVFHLIN